MFIACANFEDTIRFYGEHETPDGAVAEFIGSGEFHDFCDTYGVEIGKGVEVKVFKAVYKNDDNEEDFEEGWEWILGEEVGVIAVKYEG